MRRRRRPLATIVAAPVVVLVAGCATEAADVATITTTTVTTTGADAGATTTTERPTTTTTTAPPMEVPDGFQAISADGATLAIPESWEVIDLDGDELDALLDEIVAEDPDLGDLLTAQVRAMAAQGAVVFAADVSGERGDNLNLLRLPGAVPTRPAALEQLARAGITFSGGEVVDAETVTIPAGDALRVTFEMEVPGGREATGRVHGVQYYVPAGVLHVLTVSLSSPEDADLADRIAQTLRIE